MIERWKAANRPTKQVKNNRSSWKKKNDQSNDNQYLVSPCWTKLFAFFVLTAHLTALHPLSTKAERSDFFKVFTYDKKR